MERDDPRIIPTKPLTERGAGEPSQNEPFTDTQIDAALAERCSQPSPGGWEPPTPERLQHDFPQYEIRGILGRGGMGAVYKGWQRSLDRLVAIKILPPGLDDGVSDFTERFKREAKAMAHLRHPGIVAVHDAGETSGGLFYFIMECIEGTDVQRLVAEHKRLDPGEALRIIAAVCEALAYAHKHGVIHRDIKPSNIMLDLEGTVKVADFGLAKYATPESTLVTMSHVTMGTPDFMAPEALKGAAHADHRADIYAVGVTLYEMLTGQIPRGRFTPPSRAVAGLDKRLDAIVDRALQTEPAARYADAAELRTAIDPIRRSIARRESTSVTAAVSRKMPLLIGVGVIVLLAAGLLTHFARRKTDGAIPGPPAIASLTPTAVGAGKATFAASAAATAEAPFVNTLGQEFVPVPGTQVLFCRWETRVRDYAAFALVNNVASAWTMAVKESVPVSREPDHPVVGVSWDDAKAFCVWLTKKENAEGRLPKEMKYRLPTDEEWSRAVGLANEAGATVKERRGTNEVDFPWGAGFPPPKDAVGNYADSAWRETFPREQGKWIEDYTDGFATTAPVGSFAPNEYGIYDLGGNVWEWCEDLFDPEDTDRVVRGASWGHHERAGLLSSYRRPLSQSTRLSNYGFRCVIDASAR